MQRPGDFERHGMIAWFLTWQLDRQSLLILREGHFPGAEQFHVLSFADGVRTTQCQRGDVRLAMLGPAHHERVQRRAPGGEAEILRAQLAATAFAEGRLILVGRGWRRCRTVIV